MYVLKYLKCFHFMLKVIEPVNREPGLDPGPALPSTFFPRPPFAFLFLSEVHIGEKTRLHFVCEPRFNLTATCTPVEPPHFCCITMLTLSADTLGFLAPAPRFVPASPHLVMSRLKPGERWTASDLPWARSYTDSCFFESNSKRQSFKTEHNLHLIPFQPVSFPSHSERHKITLPIIKDATCIMHGVNCPNVRWCHFCVHPNHALAQGEWLLSLIMKSQSFHLS